MTATSFRRLALAALFLPMSLALGQKAAAPAAVAPAPAAPGAAALPPLVPREVLFGNPEKTHPVLSWDGKKLAYLAPDAKNVLQVWVRTLGQTDDAAVTADTHRGVQSFDWAQDSRTVLYAQDSDGDENFHLFAVDLVSKNVRDLTPWQGVRATLLATSPKNVDQVLVTMNVRDRKAMDVWRISLKTGAAELDTQNPGDVVDFTVDAQFTVRGATASLKDGGTEVRVRDTVKAPWRALITVGLEENVSLLGFSLDGKTVFVTTSVNGDTERVVEKSIKTGTERVMAQSEKSDVLDVLWHPLKFIIQAVAFDVGGKSEWSSLDYNVTAELAELKKAGTGVFSVVSRDAADATWVVVYENDAGPRRSMLWDRKAKKSTLLFVDRPGLEGLTLSPMKPVSFPARDGLTLNGYLALPPGMAPTGLPLVLMVHGGPWSRDTWGYHANTQQLTNRGYAVLRVNFRGSSGYGKRFLNAGNRQWGLAMHDDLVDAVKWAVDSGVANPAKVAIMGGSYGGYSTLAGLAFTPDTFRCGVDIVGPSNLFTLFASIPPFWEPVRQMMYRRVGDPTDPKDKDLLTKASPLFSAEKIKAPLLIGQGANDPRVKVAESEQIVAAMQKNGQAVTYVLYPDEGHGFARPENSIDFVARAEAFLVPCLGGRAEPMPAGGKVAGSTAVVKVVPARAK